MAAVFQSERFFREAWPQISQAFASPTDAASDVEWIVGVAALEAGARILDAPCGFGRHSIEPARGAQTRERLDASHRERVRSRDEPLARAVVAEQACDRESEGRRRGADRRERDPALFRPRALGDAAAGALGPRGALRRARRHAL